MLEAISKRVPRTARFVSYGTRVSFGYVTRESLEQDAELVAQKAAADVAAWNQRGCLSTHVIYVEDAGRVRAEDFATRLAGQLEAARSDLTSLSPRQGGAEAPAAMTKISSILAEIDRRLGIVR